MQLLPFLPIAIFVLVAILVITSRLRLNQAYEQAALFRLGKFAGIRGPGVFWLGFLDKSIKVDIRTRVETFKGQELVTKDGLTLKIDFVLWCKVVDAQKAITAAIDWWDVVSRSAETAMRDVVGQKTLQELLAERASVNNSIKVALAITSTWGVEVERVELKDIAIPEIMERAMAREAEAQRERSARLIKADGELQASEKLAEAAAKMSPQAMELRRLQTLAEVGVEHNTTIIVALPMSEMNQAASLASGAVRSSPHPGPAAITSKT